MYSFNFTLKQHSPLISFLPDEDNSGLRATEVKPKLDKFIWDKWTEEEGGVENAYKKYACCLSDFTPPTKEKVRKKFDAGFRALDYKLNFTIAGGTFKYKKEIVSAEETLCLFEVINGQFSTYHNELIEKIKTELPIFFIVTNFAKRTSKAYGSFEVISINGTKLTPNGLEGIKKTLYKHYTYFGYYEVENVNWESLNPDKNNLYNNPGQNYNHNSYLRLIERLLKKVEKDNRILKSGINPGYEKGYIKSKLFEHFIAKNIVWEKRLIKKKINSIPLPQRQGISLYAKDYAPSVDLVKEHNSWNDAFNDNQYRFVRAILGLPEQYEFKTDRGNTKFVVQFESDNAERFKSPLFFKIIENRIYACMEKDYSVIMDQHFKIIFLIKEREGKGWKNIAGPIELYNSLSTPTLEELNKQEFEIFLQNYFENIDHDH